MIEGRVRRSTQESGQQMVNGINNRSYAAAYPFQPALASSRCSHALANFQYRFRFSSIHFRHFG
jgi:hypothetical protein